MKADDGAVAAWQEAFAIFERLCALDPHARSLELGTLALTDPQTYPLVLKLLASYESAAPEAPLIPGLPAAAGFATVAGALQAGAAIGPYRLERLLGQGGMGE